MGEEDDQTEETEESASRELDLAKMPDLVEFVRTTDPQEMGNGISTHLRSLVAARGLEDVYEVLLLYDELDGLFAYHSDKIYEAASRFQRKKNLFLVISSGGGRIEPAYLISKTCKSLSKNKFSVAVPRRAKSAATLICLGADEIHMGLMSELGPIDPQIGGYPALGLSNALDVVTRLASKFPEASEMFAGFLAKKLELKDLGYFERVSESASQYAERLLRDKKLPSGWTAKTLADHLVNHYKDHGFVIDVDESVQLLGNGIVKKGSNEYLLANDIYKFLSRFKMFLEIIKKQEFDYVGSIDDGLSVRDSRNAQKD